MLSRRIASIESAFSTRSRPATVDLTYQLVLAFLAAGLIVSMFFGGRTL